ncbi:MAG: hypothetical protein ACFFDW_10205 [Candidatus Thorarchaeota archaeon]
MNKSVTESNKQLFSEKEVKQLIKAKLENRITNFPYKFWRCKNGLEHSKIAIKFLVEEYMNIEIKEIPEKISAKTFHDAGLFRLLVEFFDSSYFKAIDYTYPGMFKPWEFSKGMTGIWDGNEGKERSLEAIREMIDKEGISREEIPKRINYESFKNYSLGGMLQTLYNSSPYLAIDALYPDYFKPWEFHVKNYWNDKDKQFARKVTKWLVEEKLLLKELEVKNVKRKHFLQFGLGQMLKTFYQNSHIHALIDAYPNYLKNKYNF